MGILVKDSFANEKDILCKLHCEDGNKLILIGKKLYRIHLPFRETII